MTMFGASWGLKLFSVTPVAKLVAIRLGDGCNVDATGKTDLADLIEWCCASREEVLDGLRLLAEKEGIEWSEANGTLGYALPPAARPPRHEPRVPVEGAYTIYIIRGRLGRKIGITKSLAQRVEGLRIAGLDDSVACEWSFDGPASFIRRAERLAHQKLAAKLIRNEWFDISTEEARAAVEAAIVQARRELE
jgi:hypothetical protein